MRDGEQRIGSQLNSLVTRVNAIVNRGKTLVVNFRQAHNQANTILSESNGTYLCTEYHSHHIYPKGPIFHTLV